MTKRGLSAAVKVLCAAFLLFVLSYFFNPLNDVMRRSLTGPIRVLIRMVSPDLLLAYGKFLLSALFIGLPGLFLGPVFSKHAFVKTGFFSGFVVSAVSILNLVILEKGELEREVWFIVGPFFALVYFLLGFAGGGFWGFLGKRILRA